MEFQLASLWEALADAGPEGICLVGGGVRYTRAELDARANRVAHHLLSAGVEPGDRVGIYTHNRVEHIEALLGTWKISAAPINLNFRYVADELRHVWADADLKAMIAERSFVPILDELAPEFGTTTDYLLIDDDTDHQPTFAAGGYETALAAQPDTRGFGVDRSPDDIYVLYTGGTTGLPKGVLWRHEDIFFAAMGGGNYFEPITKPEQITINATTPPLAMTMVATAPLMHAAGQWVAMISIYSGGKAVVYCDRPFNPATALDLADDEGAQTLSFIGDAMALPLIDEMEHKPRELPGLFAVSNGGAMVSPATRVKLAQAFPGKIINDGFGSSETGTVGAGANTSVDEEGSFFNMRPDTSLLDPDTLEQVPDGEPGVLARTGQIPLGYLNDPAKTAATFPCDTAGTRWVMSGDWAVKVPDGRYQLLGRGSTTINSGGEKIHPEEVEAACRTHPAVADVIVTGVPDRRWGSRVVAIAQPATGSTLDLAELQVHCRAQIAGYKVPRDLVLADIRHTAVGKPDTVWARSHACTELGIEPDSHGGPS